MTHTFPQPDLSGVLVRIERAKAHLSDFDARARPLVTTCQNGIVREHDEDRSEYTFRLAQVPVVAPILSAILGDAIHNLRVSLDYLMWRLVIADGMVPNAAQTKFPIITERPPDTYPNISPHLSMDLRLALDEVQPYKRMKPANHELAILRELDNKDKHRSLLIAILGVKQPSLSWMGEFELTSFNEGPYSDGSEICRFAYSAMNGDVNPDFKPSIALAVTLNEPIAGAWRLMHSATDLARLPLTYIENKVLPHFRDYLLGIL